MDNLIFNYSAIIFYLACSALLFFHLKNSVTNAAETAFENTGALSKKQIITIGLAALCLHGLALYSGIISPAGVDFGFYNAASLVTAVIVLFTLIAVWRYPVDILAVVLLPLAAITLLIDSFNNSHHMLSPDSSNALIFHILSSIIAYSILALAALQAVLLSIQNKFLHAHQPGGFIKLMPPLRNMEVLLFEVIIVGFIALTISLGSGLIFLENMFEQQLAHKTVLSIIAWFVFLTLLIGHWKLGWRGRTAIRWTLSGFASLMLAYFGSKFVLEIVLV
ncbi:Inner membrane protein YpjD [hydrothermal vent metagenome]|uniref:Inner membrane protein YpjD n=1 Tax=hydrothermal vent metagenome TaxID=652676 RepID=A0A3B0W7V6_9ZZZZ